MTLALLALALAAALLVRPWRLFPALATPALAVLVGVSWLWAWPGLGALPLPLHWSAAPLAVLMLGWPLAVPTLLLAALGTLFTVDHSVTQGVHLAFWSGVLPATFTLVLGHAVRLALGTTPAIYLMGRAFFVPLLALAGCQALAVALEGGMQGQSADMQAVALFLMAMGEAAWTCAVASLLVAYRPQWLATWSDALYIPPPPQPMARRPR